MKRTFTVTVFERRHEGALTWIPLVRPGLVAPLAGKSELRLRDALAKALGDAVRALEPVELELLERAPGTRLHPLSLDLQLPGRGGRIGGRFPFVLEPRWSWMLFAAVAAFARAAQASMSSR